MEESWDSVLCVPGVRVEPGRSAPEGRAVYKGSCSRSIWIAGVAASGFLKTASSSWAGWDPPLNGGVNSGYRALQ